MNLAEALQIVIVRDVPSLLALCAELRKPSDFRKFHDDNRTLLACLIVLRAIKQGRVARS